MTRKLMLPVLALCAFALVSTPALAHKKQAGAIAGLTKAVKSAYDEISGIKNALNETYDKTSTVDSRVTALDTKVNAITAGATAALTAINNALQNSTTGLVGLNLARPQFGAFSVAGAILGSTGLSGGSGPKTDAVKGSSSAPDRDGLYVVDFGNDVSKRVYTVNVFPYVPTSLGGGGTTPYGSALNCAASATASAVCGAVGGVASDSSPNKVLVQIGDGSSGGAANGFTVTAISG